jgi:hypothetical protein
MNKLVNRQFNDGRFFEDLFFRKILLYSESCQSIDKKIPIKFLNRKFSILFLTREQTYSILKNLESKGLIKIEKSEVVIMSV